MHHKDFVVDERSERKMSINLVDQLQQSVGVVSILLVDLAREPVAVIHHSILMIATVQHYTAGKDDEAGEEDEKHLQALLASVHEVAVENVTIVVGWQTILRELIGD